MPFVLAGLIAFIVQKTNVLAELSCRVFGDPTVIPEDLENVHMLLFMVMVMFLLEVVLLMLFGKYIAHRWSLLEAACSDEAALIDEWTTTVSNVPSLCDRVGLSIFNRQFSLRERLQYMLIRREFVKGRKSLSDDFDFSKYMSIVIGRELGEIVEVKLTTWLTLELIVLAFYGYLGVRDWAKVAGVIGFMASAMIGLVFVRFKLNNIHEHLTPEPPKNLAFFETSNVTPHMAFQQVKPKYHNLPLKARTYLGRLLFGDPPTRHELLFWFDRYGPRFLFALIQTVLLLSAVYIAMFAFYISNVIKRLPVSTSTHAIIIVSGVVPIALILFWLMPGIITLYIEVVNIEMLAQENVVRDVVRAQKTAKALRAMKMMRVIAFTQYMREKRGLAVQVAAGAAASDGPRAASINSSLVPGSLNDQSRSVIESIIAKALGKVSPSRAKELRDMFALFDEDHSGRIELDELGRLMEKLGEEPLEPVVLKALVDSVDTDGNQELDCDEFVELFCGYDMVKQMDPEDSVQLLFRMLDADGSGSISLSELGTALNALGDVFTLTEVEELLRDIDRNGDGEVDFEEFKELIERYGEIEKFGSTA